MTPTKLAARATLAGITISALGLLLASPASAHTNNIYGFVYPDGSASWATLDRTNGDATLLPTAAVNEGELLGAEIFNEVGYAVNQSEGYSGFTWDHVTGAETAPVPLFVEGAEPIDELAGLDTRVDGTLLTYIEYETLDGGQLNAHAAIASVTFATGEVIPLIVLDDLFLDDIPWALSSIATDPLTGTTYAFIEDSDANSWYFTLNFASETYTEPVQFTATGFENGFIEGADFDSDGTLFFIYGNNDRESYELSHLSAPSTWPTAAREFIGDAAGNLGENRVESLALTIEYTAPAPAAEPALAATGSGLSSAWIIAAGVAVIGGALTVVGVKRRRTA